MDIPTRKRVAEEVRRQYLGEQSKPKRLVLKASDKSRFCADWPLSEDTSTSPHDTFFEAPLLFGRGFLAGFDRPEQKKKQWSDKKLSDMTPCDWCIFQEDFDISYKGSHLDRPHPMRNWEESQLSHNILKAVQKSGYKKPTPIQMAAIPIGLAHRDAIGVAETGSGKTASFVLPMLDHVASLPPLLAIEGEVQGPHALILAPTRELAQQIEEVIVRLSRYLHVKAVLIVGGHSIEQQGMRLSQGCDIIIATPGRLIDCLERRFVVLNQCNYVILDEADRMVAMGFEEQVVAILNSLPKDISSQRTTCMFSATMPSAVERIARRFLTDPVIINVGVGKAKDSVTQRVFMVNDSEKLKKLRALLDGHKLERLMMIFVNSRNSADSLVRRLEQLGYGATSLHGGMSQEQREASLKKFKSGHYKCLVATDILGRGIDIQGVAHVVNYEMPETIETYTHRIGRIGRAGNSGVATTFLTLSDSAIFYDLKQFLIENKSLVPPELAHHEASKHKPGTFRL